MGEEDGGGLCCSCQFFILTPFGSLLGGPYCCTVYSERNKFHPSGGFDCVAVSFPRFSLPLSRFSPSSTMDYTDVIANNAVVLDNVNQTAAGRKERGRAFSRSLSALLSVRLSVFLSQCAAAAYALPPLRCLGGKAEATQRRSEREKERERVFH